MTMRTGLFTLLATGMVAGAANAATEIEWWHAMDDELGRKVEEIATGYNGSQDQCTVKAVYKGNYTETMTSAVAAFRAGEQPDIVQVFEVGTATMMAAKGAIVPVHELMGETGEPFDQEGFLQAVSGYYTTSEGDMLSMPFNSSTPVLYYNKDAFEAAGLDPDAPPATWEEVAEASQAIIDAGAAQCGFTTGWQSWVQLENFSAWHDVPFATMANGFEGMGTEFAFNSPLHVRHIQNLADWQRDGVFKYGGRRSESAPLFYTGECAMYMNSSAARAGVLENAKDFEVGVAKLPHYADTEPQNSIIGGATLWVLEGGSDEEKACTADFFAYLSSPEVQADWHQVTGYLPITEAAYELTKEQGFYDENPGADVAVLQMTGKEPTANSKGLRLGNFVQVRDVINEELEAVWSGEKTAREALDAAVERGNGLLRDFEDANS